MSNTLIIPYITKSINPGEIKPYGAVEVEISQHNWANDFPYSPNVKAFLWHDGEWFYILYKVKEGYISALEKRDNGEVWNDSCVEFFISFDNDGYYNIEANCIGTVLFSHRQGKDLNVKFADKRVLSKLQRTASLGSNTFKMKKYSESWLLKLSIPIQAFFYHGFIHYNGIKAKCNIYKCGDKLPHPHYMSWRPILTAKPDFHQPKFFGDIIFEG